MSVTGACGGQLGASGASVCVLRHPQAQEQDGPEQRRPAGLGAAAASYLSQNLLSSLRRARTGLCGGHPVPWWGSAVG